MSAEAALRIEALHAGPAGSWLVAAGVGLALLGTGMAVDTELAAFAGGVALLALAAQQDTRHRKIPNWLTGSGLVLAIAFHGASAGPAAAAAAGLAALLPFGLLLIPYALGAMGAGDVKLFMVLAALWGLPTVLGLIVWTLLLAGVLAAAVLIARGELGVLARRLAARLGRALGRGDSATPLPASPTLQSAVPLGVVIAAAVVAHLLSGGVLS